MSVLNPALGNPIVSTVAIMGSDYPTITLVKCTSYLSEFLCDYFSGTDNQIKVIHHEDELALVPALFTMLGKVNLDKYIKSPILVARLDNVALAYCELLRSSPEFILMSGISVCAETEETEYNSLVKFFNF